MYTASAPLDYHAVDAARSHVAETGFGGRAPRRPGLGIVAFVTLTYDTQNEAVLLVSVGGVGAVGRLAAAGRRGRTGGRAARRRGRRPLRLRHADAGRRCRGEAGEIDGGVDVLARAPAAEVFLEGMNAGALLI